MRPIQVLCALLAVTQLAHGQSADEAAAKARDRALSKTKLLLEARPTHAALFDRYFKLLVQNNAVDTEITELEKLVAEDAGNRDSKVILGRLLLRAGREEDALETLTSIEDAPPAVLGVLGDIYFKLARYDLATRAFQGALDGARTAEEKRVVLEKLGASHLALRRKDEAMRTWRMIGELDGGKFFRRLRVAELFAEHGLVEEAAAAYGPLLTETASEPERHCRVLRDLGRLQELEGKLDDALATYEQIFDRTARGNWLRKEVEQRTVHIYRRTGRLDELSARLRTEVEEKPDDLPKVELLAAVLTEKRDLEGASQVLAAAAPRFPRDVRLARRLAGLYAEQKDHARAIAVYQRILGERPDELELYLELGTLFARSERLVEAKHQWEKALASRLTDASLCARIAAMYTVWEQPDDAVRLYERAIELESESIVRYTDLAAFQFSLRRVDDAVATLERARAITTGKPRRLETLASTFREYDLGDRAIACFEEILELEPKNDEARYGLAQLLLLAGRAEEAMPLLWLVVESDAQQAGHRTTAANTLVNWMSRQNRLQELIADAQKRASAGAAFVLGRAYSRDRDFAGAVEAYGLAIQRRPEDVQSRRLLARLLADQGEYEASLEAFRQLGIVSEGERRRTFRDIAELHLEMHDVDKAVEVYEDAMKRHSDDASVYLTVGRELLAINRIPEALAAFRHAAELKPHDPDVRFRLADCLQRSAKIDEAEKAYLQIATTSADERDREQARASLFKLYAEQGRIDHRIDELRAAVEENVYDAGAPPLLADLYLRTGDFVLGLEMLDQSIRFQPRNKDLLVRRTELLEALEEWEKAHAAHAELLKFPDSNRDLHLAGMGRALFEMGKAKDAKQLFGKIRDRGRVNKLFDKFSLHDEAIAYFERAIARNPSDFRSYVWLAEQLEKRNRRDEAIAVLERALDVRPFYRRALVLLGKLYVQADRRADAVAIGQRMFGLRGESHEKSRREEYEQKQQQQRVRNDWRRRQMFGTNRITAARQYFEERGLGAEWGEIIVAEAKRRPANNTLYREVKNHYGWRDKSASKWAAFLKELMARDFSRIRIPPGQTERSFKQQIEADLVRVWREDQNVAEAHLAELDAREPAPATQRERAMVLRSIGKVDDLKALLGDLTGETETDPISCMLLAEQRIEDKDYAEAIELLERVAAWWDTQAGEQAAAEVEDRRVQTFARGRRARRSALPRHVRRRVQDADLWAVSERVRSGAYSTVSVFSFPEAVPNAFGLQQKIIQLHNAAGDATGRDAAAERAMATADTLGKKGILGPLLFREGCRDLAEKVLREVLAEVEALNADPLQVYFSSTYSSLGSKAADALGQILADRGEVVAAFDLLTKHGIRDKAALVVRQNDKVVEAHELMEKLVVSEADRLREARAAATGDVRSVELDYRDAVIRAATFRLSEKDFAGAEKLYSESLELLSDDIEIREVIAKLRLRRGDAQQAIAMHKEIIGVKRRAKRARGGDRAVPPTRLQPAMPKVQDNDVFIVASGQGSVQSSWQSVSRSTAVSSNFRAILTILRDRNDHAGLLETLQLLLREDPTTFRSISYEAVNLIQNQDLGKKKLAILRMLKPAVLGNEWLMLAYGQACIEADELNEAERTLEELIATKSANNDYYTQQAQRELEKIEQKRGTSSISVADLRAKVESDPENVRHRLKLAKRLQKEFAYREALDESLIIVERAPYMKQAKTLAVEAAAALGDDAKTLELMRALYAEATTPEDRVKRGVTLANWLYASGEREEAFEIIGKLDAQSGGGSDDFSPGNWFLDRHEVDRALAEYQTQLDEKKVQRHYRDDVRRRAAKVEFATGRESEAIQRFLEAVSEAGSLSDREQRYRELLSVLRHHPDPVRLGEVLEKKHGARETVEDLIVTSALALAQNDLATAERDLAAAVAKSEKDVYLFPLLLGLKRLRGDYDGALGVLDALERVYGGSDQTQYGQVRLSQRDRLKVERAMIHRQKGETAESDALIQSLADDTVASTLKTVADVYSLIEEHELALDWHRRYVAKLGAENRTTIITEARYLVLLERFDAALELARKAQLMSKGDNEVLSLLRGIHRRTDRLEEFASELEAEFEKDQRDAGVRATLLNVYGELGRSDKQLAIYKRMCELPEERDSALSTLVTWLENSGRHEEAIPYVEQQVELKGGQEKKQLYTKLATMYERIKDIDKAEAAFRKSQDLETFQGLHQLAVFLERHDRDDEAFAVYEQMREKDSTQHFLLTKFAEFARERGEHREALDLQFEYLLKLRGSWGMPNDMTRGVILESLAGLPEAEREKLLAGGEDGDSKVFAAWLRLCRGDLQGAGDLARKALPDTNAEIVCLQILHHEAQQGDDLRARIEAAEKLHERVEREMAANSQFQYSSVAQMLRDEQARLWLLLGDEERARKAWLDPAARKVNAEVGRWRSDWQLRWVTQLWLSMGEFERALEESEAEFLRHESPPWDEYLQILRHTGQDERIEALCWHRAFDRTKGYVDNDDNFIWPWQRQTESTFVRELLNLHKRRGGYDAVREKLQPMLAAEDTKEQAEIVLAAIERREKKHGAIAERAEREFNEQLEEERKKGKVDNHFEDHYRIALLWQKAEQPEKALGHMRKILDFERPGLDRFPPVIGQQNEYEYVQSGGMSLKNPFSFNFNTSSSGTYYGFGYGSWYDPAYAQRGLAIALLLATGERERALQAETELLEGADPTQMGWQLTQIAEAYIQGEQIEDAVRLLAQILDSEEELQTWVRQQCEAKLTSSFEKINDAERRAAILAEQRARLEKKLAEKPFDHQVELALANLIAFQIEDHETALAMFDKLRQRSTVRTAYAGERARIYRALGQPKKAVELYRQLENVARYNGALRYVSANQKAQFGLALADAGEVEEAKAKLADAMIDLDEESDLGVEAAAKLAELQ